MTINISGNTIWRTIPSLRIVLGLITGLLVEYYFYIQFTILFSITALAILVLFILLFIPSKSRFNTEWLKGCMLHLLFIVVGYFISFQNNIQHNPRWLGNTYQEGDLVRLTLIEPTIEKDHFYKAIAKIDAVKKDNKWIIATGKMLVYIRKDSISSKLGYGSLLVINAAIIPITNAGNPGGFNYAEYCLFQGITHQSFVSNDQYVFIKNTIPSYIYYYLFKLRSNVLGALKIYLPHQRAYGVAEALLIGYRNDLDREIVKAYSNTGVVHIIAISGLHLGMLYGSLVLFFNLFKKRKWVSIIKPIVILIVIWSFALIAGGVPSIMRSAFMFSCILLSSIINKRSKIYNTLSLSALCMIIYNPFCIWDVGFQLSYAAVLSIIMYSGKIKNMFYFKNRIWQYLWQLNAVTISAQIWTFPLIIYYFHQFPKLIVLCNLIVVPLSCLILFAEIFLLFIGTMLPSLAILAGKIVQLSIELMNWFIQIMSTVKYGIWEGLKVTPLQTILLFGVIFCLISWIVNKSKSRLMFALGIFIVVLFLRCYDCIYKINQDKVIVYNLPKYSAIEIMNGMNTTCFSDKGIIDQNNFIYNFHFKPSHIQNRARMLSYQTISNTFLYGKERIVIVNKSIKHKTYEKKILVNLLIISHNPPVTLKQLISVFDCKHIVIDGSNSVWKKQQLIKENKTLLLPLFTTQDKGAFILEL